MDEIYKISIYNKDGWYMAQELYTGYYGEGDSIEDAVELLAVALDDLDRENA